MQGLQCITVVTRELRSSDTVWMPRVSFKPRSSRRGFTSGAAPPGPAPARRRGALTAPSPAAPTAPTSFSSLHLQLSRGQKESPAAPPAPGQSLHLAAPLLRFALTGTRAALTLPLRPHQRPPPKPTPAPPSPGRPSRPVPPVSMPPSLPPLSLFTSSSGSDAKRPRWRRAPSLARSRAADPGGRRHERGGRGVRAPRGRGCLCQRPLCRRYRIAV